MKRTYLLLAVPLLLFVLGCGDKSSIHFKGKVTGMIGDVERLDASSNSWKPLEFNDPVALGDSIRTKEESQVEITFNGENTMRLDENTRVRLKNDVDTAGIAFINVYNGGGTVLSNIKHIPEGNDRYRVTTPTSAAVVKGTIFSVTHSLTIGTDIHCFDGAVWAFNPFIPPVPPVVILPGFFTTIPFGLVPVVPAHIPPGQWKKFHGFMPAPMFMMYTKKFHVPGMNVFWGMPMVDMHGKHLKVKPGKMVKFNGGPGGPKIQIKSKGGPGGGPGFKMKASGGGGSSIKMQGGGKGGGFGGKGGNFPGGGGGGKGGNGKSGGGKGKK